MKYSRSRLSAVAMLIAIPGLSLAVDGTPSFNIQTDTGLYVWRTWNGDWQARAVTATGAQRVAGSFQTGQAVVSARRLSLEADDVLRVSSERTVHFDLRTAQRTIDGLVLYAGSGGVCLRTNSSLPVYLGRDARPAASPVDLTGSGACTEALPVESSLVVFRASRLDWQVRLQASGSASSFDGMFEFSEPLASHQLVSVEGPDRVFRPAPNRLGVHFEAWPPWYDGVDFTTAEFSRICLRSTAPREQIVSLLSPGQKEPSRVVTPVDLTNNGACGLPADPFPPPTFRRKFNAGHYVVLTPIDDEASMAESVVPGVKGFVQRYSWRQLEPTRGNYDLSAIASDLAAASRLGMQLVAFIEDKTFRDTIPTPDYLIDRTLPNIRGGYTAVRWDPFVVARYKALTGALGARFDSNPRFEGIAVQEAAHGLDDQAMQATQYTPEKYRDALIDVLTGASHSLPSSRVFWFMNYLWGGNYYQGEIARKVAPLGVVMGTPDVMPDDESLPLHAYPFYDGAVGRMPLFGQVEPENYRHPHADPAFPTTYWTPAELFQFARDDLHVSYMFWVRSRWRQQPDSYNWWDAIPVIRAYPRFNQ